MSPEKPPALSQGTSLAPQASLDDRISEERNQRESESLHERPSPARKPRRRYDIFSRKGEALRSNDQPDEFVNFHPQLPDSDVLKAAYFHTTRFYANTVGYRRRNTFASMDGPTLITMGILLEELAKHTLGETGDLVLVEPDEEHESECDLKSTGSDLSTVSTSRKRSNSTRSVGTSGISSADESASSSRRRVNKEKKRARFE